MSCVMVNIKITGSFFALSPPRVFPSLKDFCIQTAFVPNEQYHKQRGPTKNPAGSKLLQFSMTQDMVMESTVSNVRTSRCT